MSDFGVEMFFLKGCGLCVNTQPFKLLQATVMAYPIVKKLFDCQSVPNVQLQGRN